MAKLSSASIEESIRCSRLSQISKEAANEENVSESALKERDSVTIDVRIGTLMDKTTKDNVMPQNKDPILAEIFSKPTKRQNNHLPKVPSVVIDLQKEPSK